MLTSINLSEKTFEQILDEAMDLIPIYSKEWTNYNPSDPGITIIQNLAALSLLQKEYINTVDERVKLRLLELLGFSAGRISPAQMPISIQCSQPSLYCPAHTKFASGNVIFENIQAFEHNPVILSGLYACWSETQEEGTPKALRDISYIIGSNLRSHVYVFGEKAQVGSQLYLVFKEAPFSGQRLSLFFGLALGKEPRNPMEPGNPLKFASLSWQYYCPAGWMELTVQDGTLGFIQSGMVSLELPQIPAALCQELPQPGYCLRVVLKNQEYDVLPQLNFCQANLVEVWQQDTKVFRWQDSEETPASPEKPRQVIIPSAMAIYGNLEVYAKDQWGDLGYRHYEEEPELPIGDQGRYYIKELAEDGTVRLSFTQRQPLTMANSLYVICYDQDYVYKKKLGTLYGFDNQVLETGISNLIENQFEVLVEEWDGQGQPYYLPFKPEQPAQSGLCYEINQRSGQIRIKSTNFDNENPMILAACVLSLGSQVSIKEGKQLRITGGMAAFVPEDIRLSNPAPALGGTTVQNISQLKNRLINDLDRPGAAITEKDYEAVVKETPGLLIHKVKAKRQLGSNRVSVAVKPFGYHQFPGLSSLYLKQIRNYMDGHRLVTSPVDIEAAQYVPVDVYGTIFVKQHYENSREIIEKLLRQALDYVNSQQGFGEPIVYAKIYSQIEQLDCVDSIQEFSMETPSRSTGQHQADIELDYNQLCYLRRFNIAVDSHIELNTRLNFDLRRPLQ